MAAIIPTEALLEVKNMAKQTASPERKSRTSNARGKSAARSSETSLQKKSVTEANPASANGSLNGSAAGTAVVAPKKGVAKKKLAKKASKKTKPSKRAVKAPPKKVQKKPQTKTANKVSATAPKSAAAKSGSHAQAEKQNVGAQASAAQQISLPRPDFEALARNMPLILEQANKAITASFKQTNEGQTNPDLYEHSADAIKTLGTIAEFWLADPQRTINAQTELTSPLIDLWGETFRRLTGEQASETKSAAVADKRFSDPQWRENPVYDFLRQAYSITTNWANSMVDRASDVDAQTREKAQFYLRQITSALSPANFPATNPEIVRDTLEQNGDNLVRGLKMFVEDIEAGHGRLKIRQSDSSRFVLGENMATTPGKVIFRNDLMELIQYSPATETVNKRPLLIIPPWINKFYVLDLNAEKSFVNFCVQNGLTVFLVSWVNPDERQAKKSFSDYMKEGIFTALDAIEAATGERDVTTIGYCVGGTLLAIALAYQAAIGDDRISSATFFTTQVDFTDAGELKLFVDAARIGALEESMQQTGYLEGAKMASAFNMLRPNELIWGFFVNNYLKGKEPMPFDLLTWNSDSTRMPAANHSFYLRNCYLENNLTRGKLEMDGHLLDLKQVKIPVYNLAAKEDHIAPARSVFNGSKFFGGDMRYVMSGSGHIAGVINPPAKGKYQYWTGPAPSGTFENWLTKTHEHPGSWWPDWLAWINSRSSGTVPARVPGEGKLKAICDAPGEYVREIA